MQYRDAEQLSLQVPRIKMPHWHPFSDLSIKYSLLHFGYGRMADCAFFATPRDVNQVFRSFNAGEEIPLPDLKADVGHFSVHLMPTARPYAVINRIDVENDGNGNVTASCAGFISFKSN
jgi:hypothetical protein